MKKILLLAIVLPGLLPLAAHADKLSAHLNAPPTFQAECGSCHVAFPPELLAADDWKRVMASLDKHYGDNASLDEPTRKTIEAFLVRYAGRAAKVSAGGTALNGDLPRMTTTPWFKREHREVAAADWTHAKVKTAANCEACHTQAAEGSYREREIVMPAGKNAGRRWKD